MTDVPPLALEFDIPRQLIAARAAWRPVRRAVRYATFDAWCLAVFAAVTMLCVVGGSVLSLLVAVGLGVAAAVEFVAVRRLRRLDAGAIRPLVLNQLGLAVGLLLYAAWNLYLTARDRGFMESVLEAAGNQLDPSTLNAIRQMIYAVYGSLAVVGPAYTVATAWFFGTRRKALDRYLTAMPDWVIQLHHQQGFV